MEDSHAAVTEIGENHPLLVRSVLCSVALLYCTAWQLPEGARTPTAALLLPAQAHAAADQVPAAAEGLAVHCLQRHLARPRLQHRGHPRGHQGSQRLDAPEQH